MPQTPPTCFCGHVLDVVWEATYDTYKFNPQTGCYEESDGVAEVTCPQCGENLNDIFPDGACNYTTGEMSSVEVQTGS